jgi:Tfp pilus assembly protein PilN
MIKINLLGDALAQAGGKKAGGDAQQPVQVYVEGEGAGRASFPITGLVIVLVALAGAGTYFYSVWNDLKVQEQRNAALTAEYKTYEKYLDLEAKFRQTKQALAKKEEVIGTLKRQQALTVHFLEELANSLPDDVVFAKISQKGMNFTVEGEGRSFEAINAFYNELQKRNRWFKNINYPGAQLNQQRSYSFKISFDLQNAV